MAQLLRALAICWNPCAQIMLEGCSPPGVSSVMYKSSKAGLFRYVGKCSFIPLHVTSQRERLKAQLCTLQFDSPSSKQHIILSVVCGPLHTINALSQMRLKHGSIRVFLCQKSLCPLLQQKASSWIAQGSQWVASIHLFSQTRLAQYVLKLGRLQCQHSKGSGPWNRRQFDPRRGGHHVGPLYRSTSSQRFMTCLGILDSGDTTTTEYSHLGFVRK